MLKFKDSVGGTLLIAFLVCLVCSVLVVGAAVSLKPAQIENRVLDKQRSILGIAGLLTPNMSDDEVRDTYATRIRARLVDLRTGQFSDAFDTDHFDALQAARDPALSEELNATQDIASIKRREQLTTVYMVEQDGQMQVLVLPVRGYGLWSTMHGFIALEKDLNTVVGFGFYQHGETPGLGGEIDNPKWVAQWPGKQLFNSDGQVAVTVVKGGADPEGAEFIHQVDALAGATLTSNGVSHLLQFWLGEDGFGPFLSKLRAGEA